MVIRLKCIEISNDYVVQKELTCCRLCCRSIILQKQAHRKEDHIFVWGEDWMKAVKKYRLPIVR